METSHCPQCGQPLKSAGIVKVGERWIEALQCTNCAEPFILNGIRLETALILARDEAGTILHPDTGKAYPATNV
jgi:hypothetical protein